MGRFLLLVAPAIAGLYVWQGQAYLEYSDGVYPATSRALLGGARLYGDVVAAQPPLIYWVGTAVLWLHDSGWALRLALSVLLLAQAGLVAYAVRRLTGSGLASALAGLAALVTPWILREHTALIPETLAAPLLLGAALAAARPGREWAAGALAAAAVATKAAFVLPALAVVIAARARRRTAAAFAAAGLGLLLATFALYGSAAFDNMVTAQLETGRNTLRYVGELWAQALWNEIGLLALAAIGWLHPDRARDPALLRTLVALTLGAGLLALTLVKDGTYLQFAMILEPPALVLGAAGVTWALAAPRRRALLAVAAVATVLVAAQSLSVLVSPEDPALLEGPWSSIRLGWDADSAEVDAALRADDACPQGAPHPGPPYIAFLAGRPMPANQPDEFILQSAVHADELQRVIEAFPSACPDRSSILRALGQPPP